MPSNGIDWEGLTGKSIGDITDDDKFTIIISKLISIEKCTKNYRAVEAFYKVMVFCTPILISIMVAILLLVINHISHAG